MSDYLQTLINERQTAWHQAKDILSRCADEKRERSAEEDEMFVRANADIDRIGNLIDEWKRNAEVERENAVAAEAFRDILNPDVDAQRSNEQANSFDRYLRTGDTTGLPVVEGGVVIDLSGAARVSQAIRSGMDAAEVRALYSAGSTSGSLVVPTSFSRTLYQYMEASSAIRRLATVLTTASGEPMQFPRVGTHAIGTQVAAESTVVAGTDPVFEQMTLNSWRYGEIIKLSTTFVQDAGVDIAGFVAGNIGRALGRITDTAYVTGAGSTAPNGVVTAAGTGVKTGGSLITLTTDNLIDLEYSVVDEYRANASWVMADSTMATVRKFRDGAGGTLGAFIWQPSSIEGQPDRLFGHPVYGDGNVAAQGSAARSVIFGDLSAYYIRDSGGGVRLERSDERYFDTDEVGFRGILRTDGDLIDLNAVKTSSQTV